MKDQVIMGPNGNLAIAVPLFRISDSMEIEAFIDYSISFIERKPIAYAIDLGNSERLNLFNAEIVEKRCQFLGDL